MDPTTYFNRRRRSPSSDNFLRLFSFFPPSSPSSAGADLNESDVFWKDDYFTPKTLTDSTDHRHRRLPSLSSASKPIPSIPRPSVDLGQTQSVPSRRFQHHSILQRSHKSSTRVAEVADDDDDDDGGDEDMLPQHEVVARRLGASARTACSVLEGAGRTLKGHDIRQVRNAIWHNTGFLD